MRRWCAGAAFALGAWLLAGGSAAAQDRARPVLRVPPPVSVLADPLTATPLASGKVTVEGVIYTLDFVAFENRAFLRYSSPDTPQPYLQPLTNVPEAMAVLADRDVAFLWPALTEWAGADMTRMRDRLLAEARARFERGASYGDITSTAQSTVMPQARAAMQYADALSAAGRHDEAIALIVKEVERRGRARRGSSWGSIERVVMITQLAKFEVTAGRRDAALARLRAGSKEYADHEYGINFDVNLAARAAEGGRYDEALSVIESALLAFERSTPADGDDKIPGSELQFQWIRACALNGLGRRAEALPVIGALMQAPQARDDQFYVPANDALQTRALVCMGEVEALAILFARQNTLPAGPSALLWLQPAFAPLAIDPTLVARVRADPAFRKAFDGRWRELPASFAPALSGWKGAAGAAR